MIDFTKKLTVKGTETGRFSKLETEFPGPDKDRSNGEADKTIKQVANIPKSELAPRKPQVGEIVLLNLAVGVRPAIVLNINEDSTLDLCVFFNGPKDYTLTGNTDTTTWYTTIVQGEDEGQWKFRQ